MIQKSEHEIMTDAHDLAGHLAEKTFQEAAIKNRRVKQFVDLLKEIDEQIASGSRPVKVTVKFDEDQPPYDPTDGAATLYRNLGWSVLRQTYSLPMAELILQ